MWRRKSALLVAAISAVPAQASFLDTDFWCRTYGCAVVHDGQTYDIYDNWQFSSSSCCVQPGGEMVSYYSRAGRPLVTGTLDRIGDGPDENESLMLEVINGATPIQVSDDGDGFLDAGDTLGAFALNPLTDIQIGIDQRRYSHSFFVSSRDTRFSLRAFAQITSATGDLSDAVGLGDIKLTPTLTRRGNDDGWEFGRRANTGGVTIVSGIDDLGDLSSGPTQIMSFRRPQGIRVRDGDINEQVVRLDFAYELPPYDLSMGAGELAVDVEFAFYREP